MFRIDSSGATVDNRFTEGDPALSIPATVVSADWLNHVQEEIAKTIEEMGLTLDKGNENQHYSALLELALRGGRKAVFRGTLANNTSNADLEDSNNSNALFTVDKTIQNNVIALIDIERKTDTQIVKEFGLLFIPYNSKDDAFDDPRVLTMGDDAGVIFSLTAGATLDEFDLQYSTGDLTGTSYVGRVDITSIIEMKQ